LLFPAFSAARERGRHDACLSNMRQIGAATHMYAQDFDDLLPWGGDPADLNSKIWKGTPYWPDVSQMQPLQDVLLPYTKSRDVWWCPSDTGFTAHEEGANLPITAAPSSFDEYGSSYYYHTAYVFARKPLSSLEAYNVFNPETKLGNSQIGIYFDGAGFWHGGRQIDTFQYDMLFADGHVQVVYEYAYEVLLRAELLP